MTRTSSMLWKYVQYRPEYTDDKKKYIIVDFSKETSKYPAEIAIIQEFSFYPNEIHQLIIWQQLDKFNIVD